MAGASHQVPALSIAGRLIGRAHPPLVIAEIGINHEGSFEKAVQMVEEAARAGCECVKFQAHVIEDEMIPNDVIPGNAQESIWDIMKRCALSEQEDAQLKEKVESLGMLYLSTPFSRAAADRLQRLGVSAYKIGSGECNNYPLIEHIARFGKPVLLSTGMNDLTSIATAVEILRRYRVPYALFHCTSMYPTPYEKVRLGALAGTGADFSGCCAWFERSFSRQLHLLCRRRFGRQFAGETFHRRQTMAGSRCFHLHRSSRTAGTDPRFKGHPPGAGGSKTILPEEQPTIAFAYACVVTTRDVRAGEELTTENVWVKRPGTGEIKAVHYSELLGRKVKEALPRNTQIKWANLL